jgi:hypothetical protein
MQTLLEKQKTGLIKRFHTLLGKAGMDNEQKLAILAQYGVESSKDLSAYELLELCNKLDKMSNPQLLELDLWRKRLIAAIGAYLRATDVVVGNEITLIKKIACIAAKKTEFNQIPLDRLKGLYNAFKNREADILTINKLTEKLIAGAGLTVQGEDDNVEG